MLDLVSGAGGSGRGYAEREFAAFGAERLITLHNQTRFVQFAHWLRLPTMSHKAAVRSLELVAARVIPAVRAGVCR